MTTPFACICAYASASSGAQWPAALSTAHVSVMTLHAASHSLENHVESYTLDTADDDEIGIQLS